MISGEDATKTRGYRGMLATRAAAVVVGLALALLGVEVASGAAPTFDKAQWVWHRGKTGTAGTWYFHKEIAFPAGQKPKKAQLLITCDNIWTLYINGKPAGSGSSWERPQNLDITGHLVIEKNAIAITGVNTVAGPAGLLVKLVVEFENAKTIEVVSDRTWISTARPEAGWKDNGFVAGPGWTPVTVIGPHGIPPWHRLTLGNPSRPQRPTRPVAPSMPVTNDEAELAKPIYRSGVVFVGGAVGLNVNRQPIYHQNIRRTRAYFEMDPMTPAALGRHLWSLIPLRPDGVKTLLCDAGTGTIGSPSVSYDGKTIYFTMARAGEAYFHIYKIDLTGTGAKAPGKPGSIAQLTDGPFHDYDPVELPDGRIAFSSTRIGSREEYHAKYASCLFALDPRTGTIRPLTYHIVADREPRVAYDGGLVFIRSDNFLNRAKVETHLHRTHLDGTAGQVIIGPGRRGIPLDRDVAAEPALRWLRQYGVGSPAPMSNGLVAAINQTGMVTSATPTGQRFGGGFLPFDLSPLPDGRLLCTSLGKNQIIVLDPADGSRIAVFAMPGIHSVTHLGPRKRPTTSVSMVDPSQDRRIDKTGYLYCQNALNTPHTAADIKRTKAVRVFMGRPFTLEPTKTIYAHIGTVGVELGTVPLAEDGSFYVQVPADRPLAIQAIDGEGRAVINELSWIYARPGEMRACVGCHAPMSATPTMTPVQATRAAPLKLTGQGRPHRFRASNGANGGIVNMQLDKFREVVAINLHDVPDDSSLSTIRRLGILRNRSAVPVLAKALLDDCDEVRCAAAISLSACGDRRAVPPLTTALADKNPIVARAAANALAHLTGSPQGGTDFDAIEAALIARMLNPDQIDRLDSPAPAPKDGTHPAAPKIEIISALYGVRGKPAQQIDITGKLHTRIAAGNTAFAASFRFAGRDPAVGIHKTTEMEYLLDGTRKKVSLREGATFDFLRGDAPGTAAASASAGAGPVGPDVYMAIEALGHIGGQDAGRAIRLWLADNPAGELRLMMAAMRSLGYLRRREAIPDLIAIMAANLNARGRGGWGEGGFNQKPVYLSATAAEALGRIGGPEAEKALLATLAKAGSFEAHVMGTGEHGWLRSAQASPIYFRILEALDRMACDSAGAMAEAMIVSIPSDKDRGLLYELDSYEKLVGRVLHRSGRMAEVTEACLAVLDKAPPPAGAEKVDPAMKAAVSKSPHHEGHIRKHSAQSRAAQVLSIVCMDVRYADRIRTVLQAYRVQEPSETRSWVCFMLTRALGRLGDAGSIDLFVEMLQKDPTEAELGLNPPPAHIIYKGWRPFYRPAAAWALGRLKAKQSETLLRVVQDLRNASSTREQAAIALGRIGETSFLPQMLKAAEEYPELTTRRALLESAAKMSQ